MVSWVLLAACGSVRTTSGTPTASASPSAASPPPPSVHLSGRIVFERWDPTQGSTSVFIANADGTSERELFARGVEVPHWSPDGKTVSVFCCDDGMVAHLIDVASGAFQEFPPPDPKIEAHCGPWSSDGGQLLCRHENTKLPLRWWTRDTAKVEAMAASLGTTVRALLCSGCAVLATEKGLWP